eukprot:TRINITY_DN234_c0_g1_i7.p1 TRINITY_DN234_c0_g1~~TRINITY_DN234_c0_g1_i7.p1  ORF type:complete len:266 (-),score=54.80 TRINITY_DN234_c0_g1_i7:76-873(-)
MLGVCHVMGLMNECTVVGKQGPDSTRFTEENVPLPLFRKAIRNLAKFQAKFWNSEILSKIPHLQTPRDEGYVRTLMRVAVDNILKLFGDVLPASWTKDHFYTLLQARESSRLFLQVLPTVVTHSDYRFGNMLVAASGGKFHCTIVDWQGFHLGNPFSDLAYILCTDLPTETRRREQKKMISEYLKFLKKYGVDHDFTLETTLTYFSLAVLDYVMLVWFLGTGFVDVNANPEAKRQFREWFSRCVRAIEDLDCLSVALSMVKKKND